MKPCGDDLIEALAWRLCQVYSGSTSVQPGSASPRWDRVAREAYRCMEWARLHSNALVEGKPIVPLGLPPDGWTP